MSGGSRGVMPDWYAMAKQLIGRFKVGDRVRVNLLEDFAPTFWHRKFIGHYGHIVSINAYGAARVHLMGSTTGTFNSPGFDLHFLPNELEHID